MKKIFSKSDVFTEKMFWGQFRPAIVASLTLAASDMMDAAVVGRSLGVEGLAAVSITLPIFMISNLFFHTLGGGGSIRFSKLLATGRKDQANAEFQGIVLISLIISLILCIGGILFMDPVLAILGLHEGNDSLTYVLTRTYAFMIFLTLPILFVSYTTEYYLRNDDMERQASLGTTVGNIIDVVLSIVFVIFLQMGVVGAALALMIDQAITLIIFSPAFFRKDGHLQFGRRKPAFTGIAEVIKIGISGTIAFVYKFVFILLMNHRLMRMMGSAGPAILELLENAGYLITYQFDGTVRAAQPLLATYHAEHNRKGQKAVLQLSGISSLCTGGVFIALIIVFPRLFTALFGFEEAGYIGEAYAALRIYAVSMLFASLLYSLQGYYQAIERAEDAFMIATLRGGLVLIPVTLIFLNVWPHAVWGLYPATELLSIVIFYIWSRTAKRLDYLKSRNSARMSKTWLFKGTAADIDNIVMEMTQFLTSVDAPADKKSYILLSVEELHEETRAYVMSQNAQKADKILTQITVASEGNGIFSLCLRNTAEHYNPFTLETSKAGEDDFDEAALGILIIKKKAKEFFYRQYAGFNTMIVRI